MFACVFFFRCQSCVKHFFPFRKRNKGYKYIYFSDDVEHVHIQQGRHTHTLEIHFIFKHGGKISIERLFIEKKSRIVCP